MLVSWTWETWFPVIVLAHQWFCCNLLSNGLSYSKLFVIGYCVFMFVCLCWVCLRWLDYSCKCKMLVKPIKLFVLMNIIILSYHYFRNSFYRFWWVISGSWWIPGMNLLFPKPSTSHTEAWLISSLQHWGKWLVRKICLCFRYRSMWDQPLIRKTRFLNYVASWHF